MELSLLSWDEVLFTFSYFFLPLLFGLFHRKGKVEAILFYYLLLGIGIQGLITGFTQAFLPELVASFAQWSSSPFLIELGLANISFGLLALISLFQDRGWQLATLVGYSIFLLLTGTRHMVEILLQGATVGNTGAFALVDFLMPITILTLLFIQRKRLFSKVVG